MEQLCLQENLSVCDAQGAAAMQEIRSTGALSAETEEKLKGALEQYTENFVNTRPEK